MRNLSLGERMKCELAGALLHRPRVLFLDEPTLGLDVTAQRRIRGFIAEYAARHDATVLLTSHYMADVEALAERVIVIHHGALLFDGALDALVERFSPHKTVIVDLEHAGDGLERYGEVVAVDGLRVDPARAEGRGGRRHGAAAGGAAGGRSVRDRPADRRGDRHRLQQRRGAGWRGACAQNPRSCPSRNPCRYDRSPRRSIAPSSRRRSPSQFQYRGALVIWMHRADPAAGHLPLGLVDGRALPGWRRRRLHRRDFAAYYLTALVVSQATFTWIMWEMEYWIRQGNLSPLLVRPVHPIHQHIANNLTFKLLTMAVVIPVVVVLTIVFRPNFTISAWTALAFVPALLLAMALRFAVEWTLASLAFWVTRVNAINQLYFVVFLFLSGFVAPLDLLPGPVRAIAELLPFYRMLGFPVELLLGRLSRDPGPGRLWRPARLAGDRCCCS